MKYYLLSLFLFGVVFVKAQSTPNTSSSQFSISADSAYRNAFHNPYPFDFRVKEAKPKTIFFVGDSVNRFDCDCNKKLDLVYNLEKGYDFEFRLSKSGFGCINVFILTLKNNTWHARYFDNLNMGSKDMTTGAEGYGRKRHVNPTMVNQLWELMVSNEVLTLPDQSLIKDKLINYIVDSIHWSGLSEQHFMTTDGVGYTFELRTPTKSRSYTYINPEAYYKNFKIKELAEAITIIKLIERFLDNSIDKK